MNIDAGITYQNAAGLQAVYLPANGTNQADINGGSPFIPAMQGFWIKTNATNASVSVDNTARITNPNLAPYNAPSFFRLSASTESSIRLKVSSSTCTDETLLRFTSATSNAYEGQSDCIKLKNNVNCPSLYTVVDHNEYSIKSLSDKNITLQKIPLYLDATQNDDYSLDIKSSTLDPSIKIFVEDKKEGLIIPLSKPYVFKGNVKDRVLQVI